VFRHIASSMIDQVQPYVAGDFHNIAGGKYKLLILGDEDTGKSWVHRR
jgi:hypothetical protein